jgi:hypothetical protein
MPIPSDRWCREPAPERNQERAPITGMQAGVVARLRRGYGNSVHQVFSQSLNFFPIDDSCASRTRTGHDVQEIVSQLCDRIMLSDWIV